MTRSGHCAAPSPAAPPARNGPGRRRRPRSRAVWVFHDPLTEIRARATAPEDRQPHGQRPKCCPLRRVQPTPRCGSRRGGPGSARRAARGPTAPRLLSRARANAPPHSLYEGEPKAGPSRKAVGAGAKRRPSHSRPEPAVHTKVCINEPAHGRPLSACPARSARRADSAAPAVPPAPPQPGSLSPSPLPASPAGGTA